MRSTAVAIEELPEQPAEKTPEPEATESPKLSQAEIARAATNDPALSVLKVTLGDREFTIVDLGYDDYTFFMAKLQPLIMAVTSRLLRAGGVSVNSDITPQDLLTHCTDAIPELALLVAQQTDPTVTIEELKRLAKTPFKLARLPFAQINQNHMIEEIGDFFVQILPLLSRPQ